MRKNLAVILMLIMVICSSGKSDTKILLDEVVDIYVGSNVTEGLFMHSDISTDPSGNQLFQFNFELDEYEISYDHTQFRHLDWTLSTTDLRPDPDRPTWADVQSGKVSMQEWARNNVRNTRTGILKLPRSEVVTHFGPTGDLPRTIICTEENLTISLELLGADEGSPSDYYKNLTIRIIIELEN